MPRLLEEVPDAATLTPATLPNELREERQPQEFREGATLRASVQLWHGPHEWLTALLGYTTADLSLVTQAEASASEMMAAIAAQVDDDLPQRIEALAVSQASARLANAVGELQTVEQRVQAARESYDAAVAGGRDPRQHRPALNAAQQELEDVRKWRQKLSDDWYACKQKLAAVRQNMLRERIEVLRSALPGTRAALRDKAERYAAELVGELLVIDAAERALAK